MLDKHFRIDLGILVKGKQEGKKTQKTQTKHPPPNPKAALHSFLLTASSSTSSEMGPPPSTQPSKTSSVPPLSGAPVPREDEAG